MLYFCLHRFGRQSSKISHGLIPIKPAALERNLSAGLIFERAREPDALSFALGLSYFASSEPGRLSLIGMDFKRSG